MLHKVALNIYNKPWLIEPQSAINLLHLWEKIMNKETTWQEAMEENDEAYRSLSKLFAKSDIVFAPENQWQLKDFKGFDGATVAVIPVNGPLMKYDFCGWFGTANLGNMLSVAEKTESVKVIALLTDSPGGTVAGTSAFAEKVKKSKKYTMGIVEDLAASAAYWITSSAKEVVATSKTDIIGSIGTMSSWYNWDKADEATGVQLREFYATKSVDKNRAFSIADKTGDGRMLVEQILDPLNNEFLSSVKTNRKDKIDLQKEDVLTGKTYVGQKAKEVGLIDGIMSFDQAMQKAIGIAKTIK